MLLSHWVLGKKCCYLIGCWVRNAVLSLGVALSKRFSIEWLIVDDSMIG